MGVLDGKVCVITGGAGSIGRAAGALFAAEGGRVMLVDLDQAALSAAAKGLAGEIATFTADVADAEATKAFVAAAVKRFGAIDVLFANAGMSGAIAPVTDYPDELFDRVMAVNVRASFLACKYGLPHMNDGGSIIITSSIMGVRANPNIVGYATSKHAVVGLARVVAKEVAARRIRVNVLAPGPVDNAFQTDIEDRLSAAIGLDASSFSTAGVYMADGGMNA